MIAVSLPLLGLAILELLLTLGAVESDLSLIQQVGDEQSELPFRLNPQADEPYFGRFDLGGPEPRRFQIPAPPDTYRIVVAGGSTVLGFPYPPELAFPRQLEEQLKRQLPDRRVEVLNAGMIAINSFSVVDVVRQAVAAKPDLIIVHTGHNEFYGPGGVASTSVIAPDMLYPLAIQMRHLRLMQLLNGWTAPANRPELMETLPRSSEIRLSSPLVQRAAESYRRNLRQMIACANDAGIPILLTTVASNLRDHSPAGAFLPEFDLPEAVQKAWTEAFDGGRFKASQGDCAAALALLVQAEQIDAGSSLVAWRKAQCLEKLERWAEAREAFRTARDLDGCRFRAPEQFRSIVQQEAENSNALFLDIAGRLESLSGHLAPGHDFFLEHVHYNLSGHFELARWMAEAVTTDVLRKEWHAERSLELTEFESLLDVQNEDHLAALSLALDVYSVPPMTEAFDVNKHRRFLMQQLENVYRSLDPGRQEVFGGLSTQQMAAGLLENLYEAHQKRNEPEQCLQLAKSLSLRRPWDGAALGLLAASLAEADRIEDSRKVLEEIRRLNP